MLLGGSKSMANKPIKQRKGRHGMGASAQGVSTGPDFSAKIMRREPPNASRHHGGPVWGCLVRCLRRNNWGVNRNSSGEAEPGRANRRTETVQSGRTSRRNRGQ